MKLTEKYLRKLLRSRRVALINEADFITCKGMNQEEANSVYREVDMIDRILAKEETIQLDLSAYKYFDGILKVN